MPPRKRRPRSSNASSIPDQVLAAVVGQPWAITPQGLELVLAVVSRGELAPQAIELAAGRELDNTRTVTVRDGVALVPVRGPLVARASMFDAVSGATSYQTIVRDVHEAVNSSEVSAIVLRVASPGGQVHGCGEAAELLASLRGRKPIIAYVEGDACSAAYWLASACDEIVAAESALLGCLGVQVAYLDDSRWLEQNGLREVIITSSQTPEKNRAPVDDAGLANWQAMVDRLADVFLNNVASYRGVNRADVDSRFGQGGVLVGADAVSAGLADRLGSYESLHAELASGAYSASRRQSVAPSAATHLTSLENSMPARTTPKASAVPATDAPATADAAAVTSPSPRAAAFENGASVRSLVSRSVGIAENDEGTIADVRDGTFYGFAVGDGDAYLWLAEDELEALSTPPADQAPADQHLADAPADQPAAARPTVNIAARLRAAAAKAERDRITGILALSTRVPLSALQTLIADERCSPEQAAHRVMTGQVEGVASTTLARLAGDEAALPKAGLTSTADGAPSQTVAQRILATTEQFNPRAIARKPRG